MANLSIKINLQKLKGSFLTDIPGKTTTKRCLCIPVDDANLFIGRQGVYLDVTAIELHEHKFDDTHCLKQNISKDVYEKMTEDEKKSLPIIGGLHDIKPARQEVNTVTQVSTDDLPF